MVVLLIRLMCIIGGGIGGYEVGELLRDHLMQNEYARYHVAGFIISIIVCLGLGYVFGGVFGRYVARLLSRFEHAIQDVPGHQLMFGALGIISGFIIAFFPSVIIFRSYPGWIASIFLFIIFGTVGYIVAVQKKDDLLEIFRPRASVLVSADDAGERAPARILDTSSIIDGRILDICASGFLEGALVVPRFVLKELQSIADSEDPLKRNRGRRGLDVLNSLQRQDRVEVIIEDRDYPEMAEVDAKLVMLARHLNMPILTNDFNLNKVAELQGVRVLNINDLANALKPVVLPGEEVRINILKEGKEPGQGVGYLDDGTMVVVEGAKRFVGRGVSATVTSVLQTPAGRMIFAGLKEKGDRK
jgi:uncharacterized protein YacL